MVHAATKVMTRSGVEAIFMAEGSNLEVLLSLA
jgi:hypothetical protein